VIKGDVFHKTQSRNEVSAEISKEYASAVGRIMYSMVCLRPDISFIAGMLGRYQQNPSWIHWQAVKKVLRYLRRTRDFMLVYKRSDTLEVVGYSDSDLAGDRDDRKSTSGYVFMVAQGAVSWKNGKQGQNASSTMEAEYIACHTAAKHAIWLKQFISELKIVDSIHRPLVIFCDNQAAVKYVKNDYITNENKHIDLKYHCVIDYVKREIIDILHKSTTENIADPLTKGLSVTTFQGHRMGMGLLESFGH
jgi:hypothetical protein